MPAFERHPKGNSEPKTRSKSVPRQSSNPSRKSEPEYSKTPLGQLLYDIAFTDLAPSYLARKHKKSSASIRKLRAEKSIKALRRQNGLRG